MHRARRSTPSVEARTAGWGDGFGRDSISIGLGTIAATPGFDPWVVPAAVAA